MLLVHEQQGPQKLCFPSCHSVACGEYKRNIHGQTKGVHKTSKCLILKDDILNVPEIQQYYFLQIAVTIDVK